MAYVNTTRQARASLAEKFANFRAELRDAAAKRKVYRVTLNELSMLSNRELNDLGLSRAGIKAVAYEAAYGK